MPCPFVLYHVTNSALPRGTLWHFAWGCLLVAWHITTPTTQSARKHEHWTFTINLCMFQSNAGRSYNNLTPVTDISQFQTCPLSYIATGPECRKIQVVTPRSGISQRQTVSISLDAS